MFDFISRCPLKIDSIENPERTANVKIHLKDPFILLALDCNASLDVECINYV